MEDTLKKKLEIVVSQCIKDGSFLVSESWFEFASKGKQGDIFLQDYFIRDIRIIDKYLETYNIKYKIISHAGSKKKEILFYPGNYI